MSPFPNSQYLAQTKDAELIWHDSYYAFHGGQVYPDSLEQFQQFFLRHHLTPFCDGGGSWWTDARKEMVDGLGELSGKRVLDYGCGFGMLGMYLASCGAEVWGFDLSPAAIEVANAAAGKYALSAHFEQMDAMTLSYPNDFFDLVAGFGVIHHVIKYPGVGGELHRVLKPRGKAVFHETLWDNPVFNFARRFTTAEADAGDARLGERDIRLFGRDFQSVAIEKYHLFYMAKRLAKPTPAAGGDQCQPRPFWKMVKTVDKQVLRFAPLRRYCGEAVIRLEK